MWISRVESKIWKANTKKALENQFWWSVINSKAAAGFVIRNEDGVPIVTRARSFGENNISVTDAIALRDALWLVKGKDFKKVCVVGDLKLVIDVNY